MLFRVRRTAKATLTRTFYLDEVATGASGAVSVAVSRLDGTIVQGPVNAVGPDVDQGYAFTFAGSDTLDHLVVVWSATIGGDAIVLDEDLIEVVGGFYFGLTEARLIDPKFQGPTGIERYPTQELIDRRIEVENEFEKICGQAFVPRFSRDVLSGNDRTRLVLKWPRLRRVLAVSVGGTVWGQSAVDAFGSDDLGILRNDAGWPYGQGNIIVEYEHGMDRAPSGIVRVSKLRMKSHLLTTQSPVPDRAERIVSTEIGTAMLAIATKEKTGIPEVDAELERHPSPRPDFG
jgi:hypothetical protein